MKGPERPPRESQLACDQRQVRHQSPDITLMPPWLRSTPSDSPAARRPHRDAVRLEPGASLERAREGGGEREGGREREGERGREREGDFQFHGFSGKNRGREGKPFHVSYIAWPNS